MYGRIHTIYSTYTVDWPVQRPSVLENQLPERGNSTKTRLNHKHVRVHVEGSEGHMHPHQSKFPAIDLPGNPAKIQVESTWGMRIITEIKHLVESGGVIFWAVGGPPKK